MFEKKESVLGIFLDHSKAFDTIDHNILIYKLNYYDVRSTPLSRLKSYLTGRTQQVEVSGSLSSPVLPVTYSVPQGSILSPLLFIYMLMISNNALIIARQFHLLVTPIFLELEIMLIQFTVKGIKSLKTLIQRNYPQILTKLYLHVFFWLSSRKTVKQNKTTILTLRNKLVIHVCKTKFLGLIFAGRSTCTHVVQQKHRAAMSCVCRSRFYLNTKAKLVLNHSPIISHIRYRLGLLNVKNFLDSFKFWLNEINLRSH